MHAVELLARHTPGWLADAGGPSATHLAWLAVLLAGAALVGVWLTRRRATTGTPPLATGRQADPVTRVSGALRPTAVSPPTQPRTAHAADHATGGTSSPGRGAGLPPTADRQTVRRLCDAYERWQAESEYENTADIWLSFDQLVREVLTEYLGATRVRCYHVAPGAELLRPLAQPCTTEPESPPRPLTAGEPLGPSARAGLLGHVATAGLEYVAGDPAHGPLIDDLAARAGDPWAWIWPVREGKITIGLVAIGAFQDGALLTSDLRHVVGQLLTLWWQQVAYRQELRIVKRTDPATGVLTRADFFTLAEHALADSYAANEPVVVAVLAVEGLRRLDDQGHWSQRDALLERMGRLLNARIRTDDLVGRFSDDRFVALLRRLDSGLGRLIAEKLLAAGNEALTPLGELRADVRLRAGLAGSGLAHPPLEDLLVQAFGAAHRARKQQVPLLSDLPADPGTKRDA